MHLSKKKTQLNKLLALGITALIGLAYFVFVASQMNIPNSIFYIMLAIGGLVCWNIYRIFTKKFREREVLEKTPFPEKWRKILEQYVLFYRSLDETEKRRFETEIQIFLHETRVTGIKTEIDDVTLVLAAASAEIPVFSFPEWEYDNLGEILIYPGPFTKDLEQKEKVEPLQEWLVQGSCRVLWSYLSLL